MSEFGNYFWRLLNRPLKLLEDSDTRKWVTALGEMFDGLKQSVFKMRRSWLVATAEGEALDQHGVGRSMPRYPGEKDEYYQRRLLAAFEIYQMGGTIHGTKEVLKQLGYPNTEIYELIRERVYHDGLRRYDGTGRHTGATTPWSEFDIIVGVEPGRQFAPADLAVLLDTVKRMKSAHAKPRSLILQYTYFHFRHNGQYRYNVSMQHNPTAISLEAYYQVVGDQITLTVQGQ